MYSFDLKIRVLSDYLKFNNIRSTAIKYNISKSTVHRWILEYNNKYVDNKNHKNKVDFNKIKPKTKRKSKINNTLLNEINNILIVDKYISIRGIVELIESKFNHKYAISTISTYIKILGYSRKRVSLKYYNKNIDDKDINKINFFNNIKNIPIKNIICIDEFSIYSNFVPFYARSLKGTPVIQNIKVNPIKYNIILAISCDKIIGHYISKHSINTFIYTEFITKLILDKKLSNKYLLMDNVAFHKSKIVVDNINKSDNFVLYIPPYTPELNPIEEVISKVKNKFRYLNIKNNENPIANLLNSFNTINKKDIRNFYKHSF